MSDELDKPFGDINNNPGDKENQLPEIQVKFFRIQFDALVNLFSFLTDNQEELFQTVGA